MPSVARIEAGDSVGGVGRLTAVGGNAGAVGFVASPLVAGAVGAAPTPGGAAFGAAVTAGAAGVVEADGGIAGSGPVCGRAAACASRPLDGATGAAACEGPAAGAAVAPGVGRRKASRRAPGRMTI